MTECNEIAASIWQARSPSKSGNSLNTTMPIRSFDDALTVTRHYMPGETETILSNVAEDLFERAKRAGTVRSMMEAAYPWGYRSEDSEP